MDATDSTTTADVRWRRSLAVLIAVTSVFLFYLAYPRLHASLVFLPVDTAIKQYYETSEFQSAQLGGLQERALEAITILPHHRYWEGLSLLYFLQANDMQRALHDRREAFERSIVAAEASLLRSPAQPRAWLRIAQARAWLRFTPDEVIEALKMSIYTGRMEPSLFITRLALGLSYQQRMDEEGRAMLRDQLLLTWAIQPRELSTAVKSGQLRFTGIERLLSEAHGEVLNEIRESSGGAAR